MILSTAFHMGLLFLVCWGFCNECLLNAVKCFYYICWGNHVIFILCCGNVVYHIVWVLYVEAVLCDRDKSCITMMYSPANLLLNLWDFVLVFPSGFDVAEFTLIQDIEIFPLVSRLFFLFCFVLFLQSEFIHVALNQYAHKGKCSLALSIMS